VLVAGPHERRLPLQLAAAFDARLTVVTAVALLFAVLGSGAELPTRAVLAITPRARGLTVISTVDDRSTTCAFVRIQPSGAMTKPLAPPRPSPTWTTAGATPLTASMTALDSAMRTSLTGSASPGVSAAMPSPLPDGSSRRFVTAIAERAPDRMPAPDGPNR
jgi:hypothetical protein